MAAVKKKTIGQRPMRREGSSVQGWVMIGILMIAGLAVAPHAAIIMMVGMMPSLVAYGVTQGLGRGYRCYTVAVFNLAGVMPYVLDITVGDMRGATAGHVLADVYAWMVMYSSASIGALVNGIGPHFSAQMLAQRARNEARQLNRLRAELVDEWGDEVTGAAPKSAKP